MKKYISLAVAIVVLSSCRDQAAEKLAADQKYAMDSIRVAMEAERLELAKQKTVDSMNAIVETREAQAAAAAATRTAQYTVTNNNTTAAAPAAKRKGWSNTAKGAVIGAGVGAVTGAVISKKDGEGAIIGGLAGAAVGAGTGAIIDGKKKE
ncbi:MAG TPA: YMGG-like glycine zipper-containing protein [Flavobacterium sp.]